MTHAISQPKVSWDATTAHSRDYRTVASIIRHHLREKRVRMTVGNLADMIGDRNSKGEINDGSLLHEALDYLVDVGLVRAVRSYYEATDVVVVGVYSEARPHATSASARVSQSPNMAIHNQRLRRVDE